MIILAIDSGIERCGFALFQNIPGNPKLVDSGLLSTPKTDSIEKRLSNLKKGFDNLLQKHKPNLVIMESLFFFVNKKTFISVAQSQGALLASCGRDLISVEFLTPLQIKQIVTGYGKTDKKGVEKMIMMLLGIKVAPKPDDVVDAIAAGYAYCCLHKFDHIK